MKNSPYHVRGFRFGGISSGIKSGGRLDLALIYSETPATAVGVFTANKVQAAPVIVSKRNIRSGTCSAVIVNSGNANACTGKKGLRDAEEMVARTAGALGVPKRSVLVCSTGVIGERLPIEKIRRGIPGAVRSLRASGLKQAAKSILTTDRGIKIAAEGGRIGKRQFRIAGFAKGAGMIGPRMALSTPSGRSGQATMLAFIATDLKVPHRLASRIFARANEKTFSRITVDGDTSTNDAALLLANGACGNRPLRAGSREARLFENCLAKVMKNLALQIVADGEGAEKVVAISVRGARSDADAEKVARTVATSPLVKTSFFGGDPNWGRLLAAAGRSGAALLPERIDIFYGTVPVMKRGSPSGKFHEKKARQVMRQSRFAVALDLHLGKGGFHLWTSDLGHSYVKINAAYRT